jgi:hypothetical protein
MLHSGLYWILHLHENSDFAPLNVGESSTIKRAQYFLA